MFSDSSSSFCRAPNPRFVSSVCFNLGRSCFPNELLRLGDELVDTVVDEHDPAYDSADELFETAFGSNSRNTQYDWSTLADLTDEDGLAMDEIEVAMREDWIEKAYIQQAEVEDEGEELFSLEHQAQ